MSKPTYTYADYQSILQNMIGHFKFTKKDGSAREMFATLNPVYLNMLGYSVPPAESRDKMMKSVRVFDLQKLDARYLPVQRVEIVNWHKPGSIIIPAACLNLTL